MSGCATKSTPTCRSTTHTSDPPPPTTNPQPKDFGGTLGQTDIPTYGQLLFLRVGSTCGPYSEDFREDVFNAISPSQVLEVCPHEGDFLTRSAMGMHPITVETHELTPWSSL